MIGRKDFTDLRDTTIKTFFEVCPPEFIKSYNKTEHHVVFINGSEILFRELKDDTGLGSLNLGWFYIDEGEEATEAIFERLKGRLSLKNVGKPCGWITSNPPNEDHWLFKQFEINQDPEYFTVHASTYENKQYLPDGYIEDLEKLPESWRKKYLQGQYGFTPDGKPFYEGFIENLHTRQLQCVPDKRIVRVWDYGYHHPACSFHQIDAKGRWLILKEVMGSDTTIDKFGTYIKTMCKEWYPNGQFDDYGDPAGESISDKSEKTSVEILASMGIFVTSKVSTYRERKEIIERKLSTLIDGIPSLVVDESCKTIIDGFLGGYHYRVRKPNQAFNPALFEIPYPDGYYEHLMNTAEYFAVNMFTGAETKEDKGQVIVKVVGDMKDVHIEIDETETNYGRYKGASKGVLVE